VKVPPVLVYSVLRLLAFLVPLGLMLLLPIFRQNWLIAVVFAALIGLSLSLLFLRQPRAAVAEGIAKRRSASRSQAPDEDAEDAEPRS
jgi:pilus assembly protein TadC